VGPAISPDFWLLTSSAVTLFPLGKPMGCGIVARSMARAAAPKDSTANLGFEAKLWLAADKLRNNMDAAEYKHVVLGLIPASEFCASVRDGTHDSPKPVQNGRKLVTSRHLT
jgi:hypothetical protein